MPLSDEDVKRIRALKLSRGPLSATDEQFLLRCYKRAGSVEARNVVLEKLAPLVHHKVRRNNKLGNNDIAYEDKPRHERPLGRSFEMLSEAFCGLELPGDGGQATPRGILGAVERHNENRGDLAA